jgi:hypothetical protein
MNLTFEQNNNLSSLPLYGCPVIVLDYVELHGLGSAIKGLVYMLWS